MIDRVTMRKATKTVVEVVNEGKRKAATVDAIEIEFDDHYAIRIEPVENTTEISVREAGTWSAPVDTRELVRRALSAQPVRMRRR